MIDHAANAQTVFINAGGAPVNADKLAEWAAQTHEAAQSNDVACNFGVIVAEDGQILAHTALQGWSGGDARVRYVTHVTHDAHRRDVADTEMKAALATLQHVTGLGCIHVSYWDVCTRLAAAA